jgi:histidine triad (HIT) family protein
VVPRRQVDYLFDLPDEDYAALWQACATVATGLKAATGCRRVVVLVIGYEIPHAHVHLIPTNDLGDVPIPPVDTAAAERLAETADKIRSTLG